MSKIINTIGNIMVSISKSIGTICEIVVNYTVNNQ
jgi:hypothetical protein